MNLYVFALKVFSLLFLFSTVTTGIVFYIKYKKPTALYFSVMILGFFCLCFGSFVSYVSKVVPGFNNLPGFTLLMVVTAPCYLFISLFGIKFSLSLFGKTTKRIFDIGVTLFYIVSYFLSFFNIKYFQFPFDMIPLIIANLFMVIFLGVRFKTIGNRLLKRSIKILFISSAALIPFLIMFFTGGLYSVALIITDVYFIIVGIMTMVFGFVFLNKKPYMDGGRPTNSFREDYNITDREMDIVNLILKGMSSPLIAEELNISSRTVTTHITNIYKKTEVKSRVQLVNLFGSNWSR